MKLSSISLSSMAMICVTEILAMMLLPLTGRAIERRTSGLHDALYLALATRRNACRAGAVIGDEAVLEFAQRAVGFRIVAQAGSTGLDGFLEDRFDRNDKWRDTGSRKTCCRSFRRDVCPE